MEQNESEEVNEKLFYFRNKAIVIHQFIIGAYIVLGLVMLYFQGNAGLLILLLFPAFIHYLAALGLKGNKPWGRTLSIIIGILLLFGFPFGTIFGGFLLYYLNVKEWNQKN